MFANSSIREVAHDREDLFAFRIVGEVTKVDMEEMSHYMDAQFKSHDKVSMLLIFDPYKGAQTGATLSWDVIKTRVKSLTKVERYVVVNAPERAKSKIETMGSLIPVETKTFDEEAEAWAYLGATPRDSGPVA